MRHTGQLTAPTVAIKYFVGRNDEDGSGVTLKGKMMLNEGFDLIIEGPKITLDTPARTWVLYVDTKEPTHMQTIETWKEELMKLQIQHDLFWKSDKRALAEGSSVAHPSSVRIAGWFLKKGKGSDWNDDRRNRYCELKGTSIKYYGGCDKDGEGTKLRGIINLADGFDVLTDGRMLIVDTPAREWLLVANPKDRRYDDQLRLWKDKLLMLRDKHRLAWSRPKGQQRRRPTLAADTPPAADSEADSEALKYDAIVVPERLAGWLRKKGRGADWVDDYTRRYFVLDEAKKVISYYGALRNGEPKGHKGDIRLDAGYEVTRMFMSESSTKAIKLCLITPLRTWTLIADTSDDRVLQARVWEKCVPRPPRSHGLCW